LWATQPLGRDHVGKGGLGRRVEVDDQLVTAHVDAAHGRGYIRKRCCTNRSVADLASQHAQG
jgi:hypothetical protein